MPILPAQTWLLGVRNGRQLGSFLTEAVGEREVLPTLAPEDGAFRTPGGEGTEEDYSVSALFANKNDAPCATSHAGTPPLSFIARANLAYPGPRYKVNPSSTWPTTSGSTRFPRPSIKGCGR